MLEFLQGLPALPPLLTGASSPAQALPTVQPGPVPMPPRLPSVSTPPAPAAPPQGGGTLNLLSQLAPMVMAAFRARKDPAGAAALMQGLIRGHEVARAQQLDLEQREQEKRELTARYLQQVAEGAGQFDDLDEFQRFLSYHEPIAQSLGIDAGHLRKIPFATSKANEKKRKLAAARLEEFKTDPAWAALVGTDAFEHGHQVETPGLGWKTPAQLRAIAEQRVIDPDGRPFQPRVSPRQAPLSDYEGFLQRFARERGKTPDALTATEEVEARKAWGTADNRPSAPPALGSFEDYVTRKFGANPTAAQIEQARKAYGQADDRPPTVITTGGGLSPRIQSLVDGKSRGFESNRVVLRTQLAAEAVEFADSLNPNTTNPADDQALIYAFAKAMDPDSVVREGEYATVQKYAQSWREQFGFDIQRLFSNTPFLTPQARANMKATIRQKYAASRKQYDNIRRSYADQINRITGQRDGDAFLIDHAAAFPSVDGSKPAAAGAPTGANHDPLGIRKK